MNLSRDSIELLNSLTYYNYGHVSTSSSSSRCVHLSRTNRLALVTQKCLLIVNPNLEWPSKLKSSCAQKYLSEPMLQYATSSANESSMLQRAQLDTWLQDLRDSRNASFYLNVVSYTPRSPLLVQLYSSLANLEPNAHTNSRRVPFYKKMLEKVILKII